MFGSILKWSRNNQFNYLGLPVELHPDTAPEIAYLVYRQRYELPEATLIARYLGVGDHVLELGASSGIISAVITRAIGQEAPHIAVEANPGLADLIRRNAGDQIIIETAAVSYSDTQFVNFSDGRATLSNRIVEHDKTGVTVPVTKVETLIERYHLADPVLVCDIEGAELDLVRNGAKGLRKCRALIMEIHPTLAGEALYDEDTFLKDLTRLGFTLKDRISRVIYMERKDR